MTSLNEFISLILAHVNIQSALHTLRDEIGLLRARGIIMPDASDPVQRNGCHLLGSHKSLSHF